MMLRMGSLVAVSLLFVSAVRARDDGRWANAKTELKQWFDKHASKRGPCCSDAVGFALSDVDWESKDGRYRVRLEGQWHDVPDDALITEPNRVGRTMIWPISTASGALPAMYAMRSTVVSTVDAMRSGGIMSTRNVRVRESERFWAPSRPVKVTL